MKRQIFWVCLFLLFIRLPIWESIAAIFWQSASYVTLFFRLPIYESIAAIFWQSASYVFSIVLKTIILPFEQNLPYNFYDSRIKTQTCNLLRGISSFEAIQCNSDKNIEKLSTCKWTNKVLISPCYKFELWPLQCSIALQLYGINYNTNTVGTLWFMTSYILLIGKFSWVYPLVAIVLEIVIVTGVILFHEYRENKRRERQMLISKRNQHHLYMQSANNSTSHLHHNNQHHSSLLLNRPNTLTIGTQGKKNN